MSRYISDPLRQFVSERAGYRCEYCHLPQRFAFFSFHIDHIISLKHAGGTSEANLALSCQLCNLNKGSDVATFLKDEQVPIRFFNPRKDSWDDHFETEASGYLLAKTLIGEATVKILNFNHPDSIIERSALIKINVF